MRIVALLCLAVSPIAGAQDGGGQSRTDRALAAMTPVQRYHATLYGRFGGSHRILDEEAAVAVDVFTHRNGLDASDPVATAVCAADTVFVGEVLSGSSHPTAKGTFLFTDYEIRVADIVHDPAGTLRATETRTVTRPGGVVEMDGRTFSAGHREFPRLDVGATYLLVARRLPTTGTFQAAVRNGAYACAYGRCRPIVPARTAGERALLPDVGQRELIARLQTAARACG